MRKNLTLCSIAVGKNLMPVCCLLAVMATKCPVWAAEAKSAHPLQSQRKAGQVDHVTVDLKVGGETKYLDEGKPKRDKMSVDCNLDYYEKSLEVPPGEGQHRCETTTRWRSW